MDVLGSLGALLASTPYEQPWVAPFSATVATLAGLMIGSFLNVVIWRLPRGENLSRPGSHCPGCNKPIRWFDNLPVLSWLLLRGRCRRCKTGIAIRYPMVELLTGALFFLAWHQHGAHIATAAAVGIVLAALVSITFIDLDHKIIPDKITKPGMVLGVASAPFLRLYDERVSSPFFDAAPHAVNALAWAFFGLLVGGGIVWGIRILGSWILKKEAMGFGDVKLLAFVGAFVGAVDSLFTLVLGCMAGALLGGIAFFIGRRRPMGCEVELTQGEVKATFDRARVVGNELWVGAAEGFQVDRPIQVRMNLPAKRILEEYDAEVAFRGRVGVIDAKGIGIELETGGKGKKAALAEERLAFFSLSYKYIPFGPFLSLGAAAMLLFGDAIRWFFLEGYPGYVRGLTE